VATLAVYRGEELLRKVQLGEAPVRIGRAAENEIVLDDNNKGVSRMHAEIRYEDGRYIILDLNSQNGVWIGERRVKVDPLPVDVPVTVGPYRLVLLPQALPSSATSIPGTVISSLGGDRPAEPTARVQPVESTGGSQPGAKTVPAKPVPPAPAGPSSAKASRLVLAAVALTAVVAAGAIAIMTMGRSAPPPVEPSPTIAETTATIPPTAPPAGPTDEERFQDHYGKAQGLIAMGDKAAAAVENTEALAVLPSDPRGLEQRTQIEAMAAPTAPATTPNPAPAVPGGNAARDVKEAPPSTLRVAARPGESASERNGRDKIARHHLDDGKKALDERRYADAIDLLQRALDVSDRPDFGYTAGEAAGLLKSARTGKATADANVARSNAQKLVEQAKGLAGSDIVSAVRRLREALALDPKVGGATELMGTLQEQLVVQGEAALTSAKNLDRYKRTSEALRDYDRAIQLLELVTGGHKDLAFARQRSAELKAPR
jgi:tetratricopeptide (TPR) repeat protein